MNPDSGIDLDVSGLSADDADELRALFTASATISRKAGRVAQESLLVGLAGLMDSYLDNLSEQKGEEPTECVEYDTAGAIDLTGLPVADLLHGARALLGSSQEFEVRGREDLAVAFKNLADAFMDAVQRGSSGNGLVI